MRKSNLEGLPAAQLVERFAAISLKQDDALLTDDVAKFNRLYDQLVAVQAELKTRGRDEKRALLALYDHPNAQVRLIAVSSTLAVEPGAARTLIQRIADSREFPQAGDAGMSLWSLEQGIFKPT